MPGGRADQTQHPVPPENAELVASEQLGAESQWHRIAGKAASFTSRRPRMLLLRLAAALLCSLFVAETNSRLWLTGSRGLLHRSLNGGVLPIRGANPGAYRARVCRCSARVRLRAGSEPHKNPTGASANGVWATATRGTRTPDLSFAKGPAQPSGAIQKSGVIGHPHQLPAATPLLPRFLPGAQGAPPNFRQNQRNTGHSCSGSDRVLPGPDTGSDRPLSEVLARPRLVWPSRYGGARFSGVQKL